MIHATIQLLLYALLAGFSALAFAATIAVMQAGRLKTLGFGTGFVIGQLFTCSLFVILGVVVTGASKRTHSALLATLELLLALLLIAVALRLRRAPPVEAEGSSERTQAVLERLGRMRFLTTSIAGFLLGIGGPKRLLLTALAATAITTAGVRDAGETALVVWYCALATVLVWGPVIAYVLLGERAVGVMTRAQQRLARRQPGVKVYAVLVLAGMLILDALSLLL
jgi:Sap, sulfolipid-1-addressing protein